MNKADKAWILAVAYSTTAPREITPEEFLAEIDELECEFLSLLDKQDEENDKLTLKTWEQLGSSE